MRKTNNPVRIKLSLIVLCILAVLLWAAPCGATTVPSGETLNVDGVVEDGYVVVYGTLNLLPGAEVGWVYAYGGAINIHGGEVAGFVMVLGSEPNPTVTIYGSDFALDGVLLIDGNGEPLSEFMLPSYSYGVLTGTFGNGSPIILGFYVYGDVPIYLAAPVAPAAEVMIDIKPGSDTNPINLKSKGVVPVAILTTGAFNATKVDPTTVQLAGAPMLRWTLEDVDADGDKDMLLHFRTELLKLDQNSTQATLIGETNEGVSFEATDKVQIVPVKK